MLLGVPVRVEVGLIGLLVVADRGLDGVQFSQEGIGRGLFRGRLRAGGRRRGECRCCIVSSSWARLVVLLGRAAALALAENLDLQPGPDWSGRP